MEEQYPSESFKAWVMKDANKKRKLKGLEEITYEQFISILQEELKSKAERYKKISSEFDWSNVPSVLCGNIAEESDSNYKYCRKTKKYIKV